MTPQQAYDWLAPKLTSSEREALDVVFASAQPSRSLRLLGTKRFSEGALVEQLRDVAGKVHQLHGFDGSNGTAQLWPRGCDEATRALIDKAVDYGRWRTLTNLASDVECGCIGVA